MTILHTPISGVLTKNGKLVTECEPSMVMKEVTFYTIPINRPKLITLSEFRRILNSKHESITQYRGYYLCNYDYLHISDISKLPALSIFNIREIKEGEFVADVIPNWGTAVTYFKDNDNIRLYAKIASLLSDDLGIHTSNYLLGFGYE